jgi:dTDP-4-dehydrorhamnose reductase
MLTVGKTRDRLTVVADQRGCPTAAADLAAAILAIAAVLSDGWRDAYAGIYHAAGSGETTWHGLAVAVFEEAARYGFKAPTVAPIITAEWPTPVTRPADSRLDCTRLARVFGVTLPPWRAGLARTIDALFAATGG